MHTTYICRKIYWVNCDEGVQTVYTTISLCSPEPLPRSIAIAACGLRPGDALARLSRCCSVADLFCSHTAKSLLLRSAVF